MVMNRPNTDPPSIPPCKGGRFFPTLRKERRMGHPCSVVLSFRRLVTQLFGRSVVWSVMLPPSLQQAVGIISEPSELG
jgi:hypothetical protein